MSLKGREVAARGRDSNGGYRARGRGNRPPDRPFAI